MLTERVLNLITDWEAPVDIDRLLIVTFSNAAAEEMRQRIAQRLYEKMEQEPENRALRRQSLCWAMPKFARYMPSATG